jgi:hypothetical protein
MNRIGIVFVSMFMLAGLSLAGMDDVQFGGSVKNTSAITNAYVVRGEIGGVLVTLPTAMTCTVAITSSEGTIFSKTVGGAAGSSYYELRYPAYGSTGSALTFDTNVVYTALSVASKVTAVTTGVAPASGTNTVVVQLNVKK